MGIEEPLIYARIGKNVLYVLAGAILGVMITGDITPVRIDWIILFIAGVLFLYEAVIYVMWAFGYIRKVKLKRGKKDE